MKIIKLKIILFILITQIACNQNVIFEKHIEIQKNVWNMNSPVIIETEITNNTIPYNLYLHLRHGSYYPSKNIWFFVNIKSPSGNIQRDTLELILADDNGKWYGDGLGEMYDISGIYRQNVLFPENGKFVFEIQHGMRIENLPFVAEVGLSVEKHIQKK